MATEEKTVKKKKAKKKVSITKYDDLEGKFLLVKVGEKENPAKTPDIEDVQSKLVDLFEKNNVNCLTFVTHHAVSVEIIEKKKEEIQET